MFVEKVVNLGERRGRKLDLLEMGSTGGKKTYNPLVRNTGNSEPETRAGAGLNPKMRNSCLHRCAFSEEHPSRI